MAVDAQGRVLVELTLEDTAEGWAGLRDKLVSQAGADLSVVAVAVETNNGPAVDHLLDLGCRIYPLNPKAASRYRDRKAPSGGRNDRLDAFSFADGLRTDGHAWRPLTPDDPATVELRLLCRDEVHLIAQQTALVNRLQEALNAYYPAALKAFDDWTCPGAWSFVERFPTPAALVAAGKRQWEKFLHTHRLYRPASYQRRLDIFARADRFAGPPAVTNAKSRLAVALAGQLRVLREQLTEYRAAIEAQFASHPDFAIFDSLPAAGKKMAPRLLSEMGDDRGRFPDAQSLQCYSGTAPVTIQSGRYRRVQVRRACNKHLRSALHLWVNLSRMQCVWAQAYYARKRQEGHAHATAIRALGQRWIKIIQRMWQDRRPYDEALHLQNMVKRGSWKLALVADTSL